MIYFCGFFAIVASIFLFFALTRLIQVIRFNIKLKKNYYEEIPARFDKFFWNKWNNRQELLYGKTHATPIFVYKLYNDEYIYRGIKAVPSKYRSGQRVTLYRDPKTGKVIENLNNAKSEIISFLISSIVALLCIVIVYMQVCLYYSA